MANYPKTPVLSKIKIGDSYYYLKDADARALIDSIYATELPGLDARLNVLEADPTTKSYVDTQDAATLNSAKAYTDAEVAKIKTINYEIVETLPEAGEDYDFDVCKTVYMIKESSGKEGDYFKEYICVKDGTDYKWELIGDTRIDLSNYYTKSEVDAAIKAEADRAKEAEGDLADDIAEVAGDLADEITRADTAEKANAAAIAAEVTRATGKEAELNTAISNEADARETADNSLQLGIDNLNSDLSDEISRAKEAEGALQTAIDDEETRATNAEEALGLQFNGIEDRVETIEGKEDGWDAKLNTIKLGGQFKTVSADSTYGKYVDLGNIATTESVVSNVFYDDGVLKQTKGETTTNVHEFGDLADENLANLEVKGQDAPLAVSSAKVSVKEYTIADDTAANVNFAGFREDYTPAGDVTVTLKDNTFNAITGVGKLASYTDGNVTGGKATVIDTTAFNGGTQANFVQGSKANLVYEASDEFVKEGIKARVGTTGEELECLVFEDVTNKGTASVITTWAANGDDTFTKNTVASLGDGFYTAGTDVAYTAPVFTQGELPSMASQTVAVNTAAFEGTKETGLKITGGTYMKQKLNDSAAEKDVTIVGTATVADQNVTKKA